MAVFPAWAVCLVSSLPVYIVNGVSPLISLSRFTVSDSRACCVCLWLIHCCIPQTMHCTVDSHLNVVIGFGDEGSEGYVPSHEIAGQSVCTYSASGKTSVVKGLATSSHPHQQGWRVPGPPCPGHVSCHFCVNPSGGLRWYHMCDFNCISLRRNKVERIFLYA